MLSKSKGIHTNVTLTIRINFHYALFELLRRGEITKVVLIASPALPERPSFVGSKI